MLLGVAVAALLSIIFSSFVLLTRKQPEAISQTWRIGTPVADVEFSVDGQFLAIGRVDGEIELRRVQDGTLVRKLTGHSGEVATLTFSHDGHMLASGDQDAVVRMWRVTDGALLYSLTGHKYFVRSLSFSPDNQILASGGNDGTIQLWNVSKGQVSTALSASARKLGSPESPTTYILYLAFSQDGNTLLAGDDEHGVQMWHLVIRAGEVESVRPETKATLSIDKTVGYAPHIAVSTNLELVASPDNNGNVIHVWQLHDGQVVDLLGSLSGLSRGPKSDISRVVFSPDDTLLASGGATCAPGCSSRNDDFSIRIWKVSDGAEKARLEGHSGDVRSLSWSPDGSLLASGSADGTVRLWQVK
ncbi:MAG: WD40 repeat domain-containing protein [Chloroflexota bacterium]|nr:WD40 repeat domain-containing protein [Chloroflexota bacterium]